MEEKERDREESALLTAEKATELLSQRRYAELKILTEKMPPIDLAEILEELPTEYVTRFFRLLTKEDAAVVFVEISPEQQQLIVEAFNDKELSEMIRELYLDDAVDLIEEMPASVVKRILRAADPKDRETINELLRYPEDCAGSVMTTEYVRLKKNMTVEEALSHIRSVAIDKETIYTCYVTERDRTLIGIVTGKRLMLSAPTDVIADIMEDTVVSVVTTDDKEDVARKFDKYGFLAMPVVDFENRLVGIITVDDAWTVYHEETEEDFAKMAAIRPSETTYLKTSVGSLWLARIPWLLILMISATFSSMILSFFEAALPVVLILFVPMLMDTGGNSGGQTSVTVIRGLSTGEISLSDVPAVIFKELRVALLCGATLAAVAFGKVMLVDRLLMQNDAVTLTVAFSVAIAMFITILVAKFIGGVLPLGAKRIGLDPAVMASPFITTIVDVISLLLYFGVSRLLGL